MLPRLVTIPISHFCEKARWALDRAGIEYIEEPHLQMFHYLPAIRAGGKISVPALQVDGARLGDSTDILAWVDRQRPAAALYPGGVADEVRALEDHFDEDLGPPTRRLVYVFLLPDRQAQRYNAAGVPAWERASLALVLPLARAFLRRRLRLDVAGVPGDVARVAEIFDEVGARLADGRPYLVGDRFTAADLTFAALAAPVLLPDEYGVKLPSLAEVPAGLRAIVERFRATAAGAHALRMFREERRRR